MLKKKVQYRQFFIASCRRQISFQVFGIMLLNLTEDYYFSLCVTSISWLHIFTTKMLKILSNDRRKLCVIEKSLNFSHEIEIIIFDQ